MMTVRPLFMSAIPMRLNKDIRGEAALFTK